MGYTDMELRNAVAEQLADGKTPDSILQVVCSVFVEYDKYVPEARAEMARMDLNGGQYQDDRYNNWTKPGVACMYAANGGSVYIEAKP